ncbi:MAG: VOC family protein [Pseudomonadota bacterium]|nr:VOC family protein [Pseudomonadota bacterium]
MTVTSYYPVLCVGDVARSVAFYTAHFGFRAVYDSAWYAHLVREANDTAPVNLGLVEAGHPTIPGAWRQPSRGLLVNFEVEDVDAWHARLTGAGLEPVQPLRSEAFGQRHFIVADPDGVLLDVITPIPPSADYAALYETPPS